MIDKFLVHSMNDAKYTAGVLCEKEFKQMIGVLGNYFIGKRMFKTIIAWRNKFENIPN